MPMTRSFMAAVCPGSCVVLPATALHRATSHDLLGVGVLKTGQALGFHMGKFGTHSMYTLKVHLYWYKVLGV